MVSYYLTTPFPDPARQRLFEAVAATLQADPTGPETLLLGHVAVSDEAGQVPFDAVVVQPHGIALLLLVPGGGRLSVPALGYGAWQLGGRPLAARGGFDNPFEQFGQQKADLADWLVPHLRTGQANLGFIRGLVVFSEPVIFAPDVELAFSEALANGFQVLANVTNLPHCLRQLATPEIDLSPKELAELTSSLLPDGEQATPVPVLALAGSASPPAASEAASFLSQKARKLWGWLGAADIPDEDPPYGYDPGVAAEARREEKQQLEQLRQQMQADMAAQLRHLEARENERERSIAQLRAELAQAPAVAPEAAQLAARLATENHEKAAQEAAMQASQAEAATRNQELDAKIQQLGQLIERLNAQAAAPVAAPATAGIPSEPLLPSAPISAPLPVANAPLAQVLLSAPATAPLPAASAPLLPAPPATGPAAAAPAAAQPAFSEVVRDTSRGLATVTAGPVAPSRAALAAPVALEPAAATAPPVARAPAAPIVPAQAATAAAALGPAAGRAPVGGAAGRPVAPLAPAWASYWASLQAKWQALAAAAAPLAVQGWAWLRQGQRRRVAAGGLAALALLGWGASHLGSRPPVPFQENGRWGFADASGKAVIPAQFTAAGPFLEGRAVVAKAGVYGVVNEDGKELIAPAYDALNPYAGGYARARVGDTYTFVDEQGQEFDAYYFNALDFAEGHAAVLDHRGWHYISGPAEPEKPVIFTEAYAFVDGLARVRLADGYTFITPAYLDDPSRGTKPFGRYRLATDFADGKARVTQNGRQFFIDKDGDEVK